MQEYQLMRCQHTQTNQLWIGSKKLWGKAPQDLVININRSFTNPITGEPMKWHRQVQIDDENLDVTFVENIKNSQENHTQQFNNVNTNVSRYSLYGVVNHQGVGAGSGHYINHVLNDTTNQQHRNFKWIKTNSTLVMPHNNFREISTDVTACWFRLNDVNN